MSRKKSRRRNPSFKAEVAPPALRGDRTLQELSQQHKIHANMIGGWRKQLLEGASAVLESGGAKEEEAVDVKELYRKIGQLAVGRYERRGTSTPALSVVALIEPSRLETTTRSTGRW